MTHPLLRRRPFRPNEELALSLKRLESRWLVYWLICVGLLLRIAVMFHLRQFPLASDALSYHETAVNILHGASFSPYYPPGLPFVLAFVYRLTGVSEFAGRFTSLLWYVAFSLLLYQLASAMFSRRTANIAVLLFVFFPAYVWQSVEPLTQLPTATCVVAICLLTLLQMRAFSWRKLVVLGIVLGLAILIRPSSLVLTAFIPVYILRKSRRIGPAVVPFALSAVLVCGWLVKAHDMTGRFVMVNDASTANFFFGNNPYTPLYKTWWFGSHGDGTYGVPAEYTALYRSIQKEPKDLQNQTYRRIAVRHILSRPDLFIIRSLNRMCAYFAFDTTTGTFPRLFYGTSTKMSLALIGLDALFYCAILLGCVLFLFTYVKRITTPGDVRFVLLVVLLYSLPYWFSFSHPTYHFPIVPLLGVFAAAFVVRCVEEPREELFAPLAASARRRYGLISVLVILAFIQIEWVLFNLDRIRIG
jgi:4-amino-4-deoxy-L-arabinose transferase-like glycosyltransferase